jgi:hypothetical protein
VFVTVAVAKLVTPDNPAPLQLYVTPLEGPPDKVADVLVQVITDDREAVAAG